MAEVLVVLAVIVILSWCAVVGIVGYGWRRLRRSNAVVPGRSTAAPLWWLWSPGGEARLHRRLSHLVAVVAVAEPAALALAGDVKRRRRDPESAPPRASTRLAAEIIAVAHGVDVRLTTTRHLHGAQRRAVHRSIATEVDSLERLAAGLAGFDGGRAAASAPPPQLAPLHDDLAALAAAERELVLIERRAGLDTPGGR